jgi:AP2 domain/HNH endonuclease
MDATARRVNLGTRANRPPQICACGDHAFARTSRWGVALVSTGDIAMLMTYAWTLTVSSRNAYARSKRIAMDGASSWFLHHAILGQRKPKTETDHRNGNGLDCRRDNLRTATHKENSRNTRRPRTNTSGYKGAYRYKKKWAAHISVDGRTLYLGYYATPEEAANAYDNAARKYFGEFANTNF